MPSTQPIPIGQGFYESPRVPFAIQDCMNLYPFTPISQDPVTSQWLLPAHGIEPWAELSLPATAMIVHKGKVYCMSGSSLYVLDSAGNSTLLGTTSTVNYTAQLASNGEVLCVQIPEGDGYFYDETNGFRQIDDPVYVEYQSEGSGVLGVTSLDGYFIFCTNSTLFHTDSVVESTLGTYFPALAFASGEDRPDDNMRPFRYKGELILFGTQSYETWRNVGTDPFIFARVEGATQDKGLKTYGGVVNADNSFYFVGQGPDETPGVWRHTGGSPQKVSTGAIDDILSQSTGGLAYLDNAWSYSMDGHVFVGFSPNIEGGSPSIVYDVTQSALVGLPKWHRRKSPGQEFYNVGCCISAYDSILAGHSSGIGKFKRGVFTENGSAYSYKFSGQYLRNGGDSFSISKLQLWGDYGRGLSNWDESSADSDPQILLRYSDDFGRSWLSKGERSMGRSGEYGKEVSWRRFGRVPNARAFEFSTTTKAPIGFYALGYKAKGGDE